MAKKNDLGGGSRLRRVSFAAGLERCERKKSAREQPESRVQNKMACEINHAFPVSQTGPERKRAAAGIFLTPAVRSGSQGGDTVNITLCTIPRDWKMFARNCRILGAIQRRAWNIYEKSLVA